MDLTGFNIDEVNRSLTEIFSSYDDLHWAVYDRIQNEFVNAMQDKWACQQAQDYFRKKFKPGMDELINYLNGTFEDIVSDINWAANEWANMTDTIYNPGSFSPSGAMINVDCIAEQINGVRGIDLQNARDVVANLNSIKGEAFAALSRAKNCVYNTAFMGGGQQENLIGKLNRIERDAGESIDELLNEADKAINETVQKYSDTAGKIASGFAGGK